MPCLFKRRASHPEKHRRDSQKKVHGYQGKPYEYACFAVDAIRNHEQRDPKRRLAPRSRANGEGDCDLPNKVHVVQVAERYLPDMLSVSQVDRQVVADGGPEQSQLRSTSAPFSCQAL